MMHYGFLWQGHPYQQIFLPVMDFCVIKREAERNYKSKKLVLWFQDIFIDTIK